METECNTLFGRYLNQFESLVDDNIKVFKECLAEFILMKENLVTIPKLIKEVENANDGMKSVGYVTNQLRELMYEAEYTVADYSLLSTFNRFEIGTKLKDINEKLKEMKSKLENPVDAIITSCRKRKRMDVVNDVNKIVVVTDAIRKIKKWVLNEDNVKCNRIGLVGEGGLGKTTLAEMVLMDKEINKRQKKVMFVTVSQPVDVKMMMKSMLNQLNTKTRNKDDVGDMTSKLHESLKKRRYFLILDDVCTLDGGWWDTIKNALPEGRDGCILITSRMRDIVEEMGVYAERIHVQRELNVEDGWSLFCISEKINSEVKQIGIEIVRKCGGFPLAIKLMGGVVSSCEISPPKWMEIRDKFNQYISDNKNDIVMGSLELSYDDLQLTYLQPCLLYFGIFPEDCLLYRYQMITWWIGEGFVPLTEDGRVSVELAEQCFDELVSRRLVEVVHRDYTGKVLSCKVHVLVREMLIRKGKSEAFFEIGEDKISRRIVANDFLTGTTNQISLSNTKVRAIVSVSRRSESFEVRKKYLDTIYDVCKYVRVLDLSSIYSFRPFKMPLPKMETLKHVRCLLSIYDVPTDISKLTSLLVLRLGMGDEELPSSITEMKQLIWLDGTNCCSYMPKGLGNISTLQVLKGFIPSPKGCMFEELRKLTQLVTLEITLTCNSEFSDCELNALSELGGLRHLSIHCEQKPDLLMSTSLIPKLDNLVLPKSLDQVNLSCYPGEETPPWLNAEHLPILRCLSLSSGWNLKRFHKNFYGSDQNKWTIIHLELSFLPELEGDWNVILEKLPYLETLHSIGYPMKRLANYPTTQEFDKNGVWRRISCVV